MLCVGKANGCTSAGRRELLLKGAPRWTLWIDEEGSRRVGRASLRRDVLGCRRLVMLR